jgi:predicted HD phosphohydrolase
MNRHANFKSLQESVNEDWPLILSEFGRFAKGLPDRIIAHLKLLEGDFGGFPVDRYTHSLQTATRAIRDGRDDEYVVCALLHDIGDTLGTYNHPDIAVAILKPFASEANLWMIQHHNIFQGYYFFHHIGMDRNMREQLRGHDHFERTAEFCELYDSPAFDAHAETLPISEFEPLLRRVFASPLNSLYKAAFECADGGSK